MSAKPEPVRMELYFCPDPMRPEGIRVGLRVSDNHRARAEMPYTSGTDVVCVFETMGRLISQTLSEHPADGC
jgi:hypothetical protein